MTLLLVLGVASATLVAQPDSSGRAASPATPPDQGQPVQNTPTPAQPLPQLTPSQPRPRPTNPQVVNQQPQQQQQPAAQPAQPPVQTDPQPVVAAAPTIYDYLRALDTIKAFVEEKMKYGRSGVNPFSMSGGDYSDNPFALEPEVRKTQSTVFKTEKVPEKDPELFADRQGVRKSGKGWFFYFLLTIVAYLSIVVSVYRKSVVKLFSSFASLHWSMQQLRDRQWTPTIDDILLYGLFVLSSGSMIYLIIPHFGAPLPFSPFVSLLACMGGVLLVYLLKHLQLFAISMLFPFGTESATYSFIIGNANKVLGIALVPLVFTISYAAPQVKDAFIWVALGLCVAVYAYRSFRGLAVSGNYILHNKFHFFIYLCAVEIAPIIILVKLLLIGAGL